MIKYINLILIFLISISLTSCGLNSPKYIQFKEQKIVGYYSNEIIKKLNNGESFTLKVFDSNFYKYFSVKEKDNKILYNFLNSIDEENFKDDFPIEGREEFKIIVDFSDSKYIINIFDSENITIQPWDGYYKKDIIDSSNLPLSYNLYDFCKYIEKK